MSFNWTDITYLFMYMVSRHSMIPPITTPIATPMATANKTPVTTKLQPVDEKLSKAVLHADTADQLLHSLHFAAITQGVNSIEA